MRIKNAEGIELEKEKPNTSEDFFNRSTVTYIDNNKEKQFHVLYVRYFDEKINEYTPFESDPIFAIGEKEITLKDTVALICLLKNGGYKDKKRLYINDINEFGKVFERVDFQVLREIFNSLLNEGEYKVADTSILAT